MDTTNTTSTSSHSRNNKSGYLAKYLDATNKEDDPEDRHSKKRNKDKKKNKKSKKHSSGKLELKVHDSDDDGVYRKNGDYEDEDDEGNEDDNPMVVNAKEIQQEEEAAARTARALRGTWQEEGVTAVANRGQEKGQDTNGKHPNDQKRKRHDSDSDSNYAKDSGDDDNDHSSSRPRKRHDSDDNDDNDEEEDVKPKHTANNTGRQRYDSDSDSDSDSESEDRHRDRRRVARHDSDAASQGDPKRLRHDSDTDTDNSSRTPAAAKTSSGHKAGLQQGRQFSRAEAKLQAQRRQVVEDMVEQHGMGETVFRDDQGRRKDTDAAALSKEEVEQRQKHQRWLLNQGSAQRQAAHDAVMERQELAQASFARRAEDVDLEDIRKRGLREGDPMAQYTTTPTATQTSSQAGAAKSGKPIYKGPPAPPNRYGIKPGYRWDGHHRGNNFERQLLSLEFAKKHEKEQAYRYSSADM